MNKNILVIASPHTGILDNIFPYIYLASTTGLLKFDILVNIRMLNSLKNNSLNHKLALKYFGTWNLVVDNKVIAVPAWCIKAYFSIDKIFKFQVVRGNKYISKFFVNFLLIQLFSLLNKDLSRYDVAFGDVYIFSRNDCEPYANKVNKMKFLNVTHGVNPHAIYSHDYIYECPSKIFYLPMMKNEVEYFYDSELGALHELMPDFGLLRHNKSWLNFIKNTFVVNDSNDADYILVVSRPPDKIVTAKEMNSYYSEILKFSQNKNIPLVVKPHLWETPVDIFKRLNAANDGVGADFTISQSSVTKLISKSVFGILFYGTMGADFISFNKVLIQCADESKLADHIRLNAPYGEKIISNYLDFESIADSVIAHPELYLEKMKEKYNNSVIEPLSGMDESEKVSEFLLNVLEK